MNAIISTRPAEEGAPVSQSVAEATKMVMRRAAKSVWIIASCHEGKRFAMAATAVDVFSLDPPSMLVCVNHGASLHPVLTSGANFSVNLLGAEQEEIAQACGGRLRGEDRFSVGTWIADPETGVPILADAQGSMVCVKRRTLSHGTHELFVGDVLNVRESGAIQPMIYVNGRYYTFRSRIDVAGAT